MNTNDMRAGYDLTVALKDGQVVENGGESATLRHYGVGDLIVTSGSIVACDPKWINDDIEPFATAIGSGRYPVVLSIARFLDGNERVAYATLRMRDIQPVRWEIARRIGDDTRPGKNSSYSVDSGKGCFIDANVLRLLLGSEQRYEERNYERILDEAIASTRVNSWGWANICVDPETAANIVAFSSGLGDGAYVTYVGYDATDTPICFTTDFALLEEEEEVEEDEI